MVGFTIKNLEVFLAVVEKNSFSLAANELFLSQSTVSTAISTLESNLGASLLVRNARRKVELTEDGKLLYPLAKRIVESCDDLQSMFQRGERMPPLLMGASNVPAQYILPELMTEFLNRQNAARYVLEQGDSEQVHQLLKKGRIRIGFVGSKQDTAEFAYTLIARDRLVLVTQNNERFAAMQSAGVLGRELLGEPMIAREDGSGTEDAFGRYLRQSNYPPDELRVIARMENPEVIKQMVAKGAGIAVLSNLTAAKEVADGSLLAFELDQKGWEREIYMILRKDCRYSEHEQQFINFVKRSHAPED